MIKERKGCQTKMSGSLLLKVNIQKCNANSEYMGLIGMNNTVIFVSGGHVPQGEQ